MSKNSEQCICHYCSQPAKLVKGDVIYLNRPDLHHLIFWQCEPCGAYVRCHKGTEKPLGRLANAELRKMKMQTHNAFDPLWKEKHFKRKEAYKFLAFKLKIKVSDCHIGMFDVDTCKEAIFIASQCLTDMRDLDRHLGCETVKSN